ncbi:hypothetical protein TRFO_12538 [Tritrichomonas foetus]|uniref:Uncharacterized protein n=1 Tax=Tritrichomonas foetus TaxID=1144522 RepID=A0A1J4L2A3_9EUKA|nr:hypothetical protein TRFO_12538 [Tritrichomonas foetus]|eukprot:OHT17216.1 hypothetical protein TRFO_12538 [Tritrichomonas foetus]
MESVTIEKHFYCPKKKYLFLSTTDNQRKGLVYLYFIFIAFYGLIAIFSPPSKYFKENEFSFANNAHDPSYPIVISYSIQNINYLNIDFQQSIYVIRKLVNNNATNTSRAYLIKSVNSSDPNGTIANIFSKKKQKMVFHFPELSYESNQIIINSFDTSSTDMLSIELGIFFDDSNIEALIITTQYNNYGGDLFLKLLNCFVSFSMAISLVIFLMHTKNGYDQPQIIFCLILAFFGILGMAPIFLISEHLSLFSQYFFSVYKLLIHILISIRVALKHISLENKCEWFLIILIFFISAFCEMSTLDEYNKSKLTLGKLSLDEPMYRLRLVYIFTPPILSFYVILYTLINSSFNVLKILHPFMIILFSPSLLVLFSEFIFPSLMWFNESIIPDALINSSYMFSGIMYIIYHTYLS